MKLLIYGNGAMARVVLSYARHAFDIAGFTVDDTLIPSGDNTLLGYPLIPFSTVEEAFPPAEHNMIVAVGYLEMNALRLRKYGEAKEKGYTFASYIHPSVMKHDNVTFGENCVILDNVSIHPGCQIGPSTFVAGTVNIGHDCTIGAGNWINGGVSIAGGTTVGEACFWGVNACAAHGVEIGPRTFIGANALIAGDTEPDSVYALRGTEPLPRLTSATYIRMACR